MSKYTYEGRHPRDDTIPLYIFRPKEGGGKAVVAMKSCLVINGVGGQKFERWILEDKLKTTEEFKVTKVLRTNAEYDYACLVENLGNEEVPETHQNCVTRNMHVYFGVVIGVNAENGGLVVGCGLRVFTNVTCDFKCLGKCNEYQCVQVKTSLHPNEERGSVYPHNARVVKVMNCNCGGVDPLCSRAAEGGRAREVWICETETQSEDDSNPEPDDPYDFKGHLTDRVRGSSILELLRNQDKENHTTTTTTTTTTGTKPKTSEQTSNPTRLQTHDSNSDYDPNDIIEFEAYRPILSQLDRLIIRDIVTI